MQSNENRTFKLNHDNLSAVPDYFEIARELSVLPSINSHASFNIYCRTACELWNRYRPINTEVDYPQFRSLLQKIHNKYANTISTDWGGVVITKHEHPQVEKYLVIQKGEYLALEKHHEKEERLEIIEGSGLILWREECDKPLRVEVLGPGSTFYFAPGIEHCIIGTEDLLILECSTDPKGMDQDLIFIYIPNKKTDKEMVSPNM
jgi:mannose-6-phosphate isomerase-like protein (cupin superfamily)